MTGFTPIDSILAFTGATWGSQLHAMFWNGGVYVVIILLGLFMTAVRTMPHGSLLPMAMHFVLASGLAFAFGASSRAVEMKRSITEEANAAVAPAVTSLQPTTSASLPAGFVLVNDAMHSLAQSMIHMIKRDFAERPFAALVVVNRLAAEKFDGDPALQGRLRTFLDTCYGAALQAWEADTPPEQRDALSVNTPAASALQQYYATLAFPDPNGQAVTCTTRWQDLQGALATYARTHITPATDWVNASLAWLSRTFGSDEWVVNVALRNYREAVEPPGGGQLDPSSPSRNWLDPVAWLQGASSFVLGTIAGLWNPVVMGQIVEFFQRSAYVFYGYTMMVAYAVFPIMLAFALWPGQFGRFATYLMLLLSLKMWPVFWAMIATAHEKILPVFIASGAIADPNSARYPALLQFITALTIFSVPALVSMLFGVASHRIGANFSSWAPGRIPFLGSLVSGGARGSAGQP
ncbi:MAG: hypothetical protein ACREK6_00205 [Candidatus Rokuibacteriota bacterium]